MQRSRRYGSGTAKGPEPHRGPDRPTLLYTKPARAIAAIKVLVDSGTPISRISIQTWGARIAIRARDPIDAWYKDQLLALGGEPIDEREAGVPPVSLPGPHQARSFTSVGDETWEGNPGGRPGARKWLG